MSHKLDFSSRPTAHVNERGIYLFDHNELAVDDRLNSNGKSSIASSEAGSLRVESRVKTTNVQMHCMDVYFPFLARLQDLLILFPFEMQGTDKFVE